MRRPLKRPCRVAGRIRGQLANVAAVPDRHRSWHYVARELISLGHNVTRVPPAYAELFRQTHKNDFRDAYAIAETVRRSSTRCVPL